MQNAALRASGLDRWRYQHLPVPPELFSETVRALAAAGFRGANVTIPHKQEALGLADRPTPRASAIGAANTLVFEDGEIHADNTDAPALIAALPFPPAGQTALVLGAGGSARAAVWGLIDAGAREVRVWNRTPERARVLCAELGGSPVETIDAAGLLVNCTARGLAGSDGFFKQFPIAADDLGRYKCVIDFVYRTSDTELVRAARDSSIRVVDGLELLVGQGKLSFQSFTGRPSPEGAMVAAVRRA
jgi:shikimate dehydrogenase